MIVDPITNAAFIPSQVRNGFAFVVDIGKGDQAITQALGTERSEMAPDEGAIDEDTLSIILPESLIESLIAFHPQILGVGDLSLAGQQVNTPMGGLT